MPVQNAGFDSDAPVPKRLGHLAQAVLIRTTCDKHGGVGH